MTKLSKTSDEISLLQAKIDEQILILIKAIPNKVKASHFVGKNNNSVANKTKFQSAVEGQAYGADDPSYRHNRNWNRTKMKLHIDELSYKVNNHT